jgi:hypothetical protein
VKVDRKKKDHLHLQGRRVSQAIHGHETSRRWRLYVPPKRQLNFTGLHGVIYPNIEFFVADTGQKSPSIHLNFDLV